MIDRDDHRPTDFLDQATEALRDAPIPDGPPRQLVASTVEALKSPENSPDLVRLRKRIKLMSRIVRYSGAAAAVALVAVLAGWLILSGRGAGTAFADVLAKVKQAESVSFVVKQKLGTQPVIAQKMYVQGDKLRIDIVGVQGVKQLEKPPVPILLSVVGDLTHRQALELDHFRKTAKRETIHDRVAAEFTKADPIRQLRSVKPENAERIGQEERDGRTLDVYRLTKIDVVGIEASTKDLGPGEEMKVWVDRKTGLPVRIRIEGAFSQGGTDRSFLDFDQFAWNPPLDPGLFKLAVPEGYAVKAEPAGPKAGSKQ